VDLSARLSRNRFAMLLPGTPATGARTMVQRIMSQVLDQCGESINLSVGLTEAPQEGLTTVDEFMTRSEAALALARSQGPNQIVTWNAQAR
jgi:GGDEF domain-containing protein